MDAPSSRIKRYFPNAARIPLLLYMAPWLIAFPFRTAAAQPEAQAKTGEVAATANGAVAAEPELEVAFSDGGLAFVEAQFDGKNGVDGLFGAIQVAISSDGASVYVTGDIDDAVAVFSRDALTGAVGFVEVQLDNINGVDGLNGAVGVIVSPDGANVYWTSDRSFWAIPL